MKYLILLIIMIFTIGLLFMFWPHAVSAPVEKFGGLGTVSVSLNATGTVAVENLDVTVLDSQGATLYSGKVGDLAGLIAAKNQYISDLQAGSRNGAGNPDIPALQAQITALTPVQTAIATKLTSMGLSSVSTVP